MPALTFAVSLALSLIFVPLIRRASHRFGWVAEPRQDRWHKVPTSTLGGVGIFIAYVAGVLAARGTLEIQWGLLAGSAIVFGLGLYDDVRQLTPPVKLVGQIMAAAVVVFSGYRTGFFAAPLLNILITVVWLVGITNAINLLDNMDGLAGGIALIAAGFLSYFFFRTQVPQNQPLLVMSVALTGAILGFLVYNFPPASIFMGDSGSLFLGFTLAALAIARTPQASNVFAVMSVPTLLFLLPIIDTTLVTFTRLLRGQSPVQGGRDHTSHRLVAFGLTERQAVLVLYGIAIISGVVGATFESLDYDLSLVLLPALVIAFALLAAYLGRLKVVDVPPPAAQTAEAKSMIANVMLELTYKRRMLEIALDFFLISLAYYMALWTRFGFSLDEATLDLYLASLPVVLGSAYIAFFVFGVYRGVWRYIGVEDLTRAGWAVISSALAVGVVITLVFRSAAFSPVTFFLYAVFLFLGLAFSRSSFKVLDQIFGRPFWAQKQDVRVFIYGAGDVGEMALRWILRNPTMGFRVLGFLDDDPFKWGRSIHGVKVLGGEEHLQKALNEGQIDGLILTSTVLDTGEGAQRAIALCRERGVWVRSMRLEFELLA